MQITVVAVMCRVLGAVVAEGTHHHFDKTDFEARSKAEKRFEKLTGQGFTAAVRSASGDVAVTRTFDVNAEETLFFPRLVGGQNLPGDVPFPRVSCGSSLARAKLA